MAMINIGPWIINVFLLITLNLYVLSKTSLGVLGRQPIVSLSQILALWGAVLLSLTFVLSSRVRFLEKWFGGLDKLYKYHHKAGVVAFVMLLHHPLLLAVRALPNFQAASIYLFPSREISYLAGVVAIYSLIMLLILTLLIKLPYQWWLKTHQLMGVVLLFAVIHVLLISSDISTYIPLRYWILANMGAAIAAFIYRKFLYRWWAPKSRGVIEKVLRRDDLIEVFIKPDDRFSFEAGQFGFVRFQTLGVSQELHPFSFSSSPSKELVRLSIKIEGDFTLSMRSLKPGDRVEIYGPYGMFGRNFYGDKEVVGIAGGIGVTPFLSLLASEKENPKSRKINLIYSNRSKENAWYEEELAHLEKQLPNLKFYNHISEEKGRVTVELMEKLTGGLKNKRYYLCGPTGMMMDISNKLIGKGVNPHLIHFEDFSLK